MSIKVLKFGGTSVGSADALSRMVSIVRGDVASGSPVVVVVSALSGVTNALDDLIQTLDAGRELSAPLAVIRDRHLRLAAETLHAAEATLQEYTNMVRIVLGRLDLRVAEIRATGRGATPSDRDAILSVGERLSAPLAAMLLRTSGMDATWVDARHLIRTDDAFGEAIVREQDTSDALRSWHAALRPGVTPVMTGYIGRSVSGRTTTLGRGGSDYTAALVAEALGASKLDRWTDVNGIHTADPRTDPTARRFAFLLAEDASTWNAARALGMHERAFDPVVRGCIPVHVRSTELPHGDGTLILPAQLPERIGREARRLRVPSSP